MKRIILAVLAVVLLVPAAAHADFTWPVRGGGTNTVGPITATVTKIHDCADKFNQRVEYTITSTDTVDVSLQTGTFDARYGLTMNWQRVTLHAGEPLTGVSTFKDGVRFKRSFMVVVKDAANNTLVWESYQFCGKPNRGAIG
jgi:hypothetical protein